MVEESATWCWQINIESKRWIFIGLKGSGSEVLMKKKVKMENFFLEFYGKKN